MGHLQEISGSGWKRFDHSPLRTWLGFHCYDIGYTNACRLARGHKQSCVVEVIAMPSETSNNFVANCS